AAAGRRRRNLHRDLSLQRRDLHRGAERRLRRGDRQIEQDVVTLALELGMRRDRDLEVGGADPAPRAAPAAAAPRSPGEAPRPPRPHAGGDPNVELALGALPAAATARLARLSIDVA